MAAKQPDIPLELIDQAQSCSQAAENELFRELNARIALTAKKRLWGRRELAEDVTQNVHCTMCEQDQESGVKKYKTVERDHFLPWVFQILRFKIGNEIRRRRSTSAQSFEDMSSGVAAPEDTSEEPLSNYVREQIILKALQQLDPNCREIILALLRECQGYDLPPKFAKLKKSIWYPRKSRCLKKLREILKKEG